MKFLTKLLLGLAVVTFAVSCGRTPPRGQAPGGYQVAPGPGANPQLGDRSSAESIAESELGAVLAAARAFRVGG